MFRTIARRFNNDAANVVIYVHDDSTRDAGTLVFDGGGLDVHRNSNKFRKASLEIAKKIDKEHRPSFSLDDIFEQIALQVFAKGNVPSIAITDAACFLCERVSGDKYFDGDCCYVRPKEGSLTAVMFNSKDFNLRDSGGISIEQDGMIAFLLNGPG